MRGRFRIGFLAMLLVGGSASSARAGVITFNSEAAFLLAAGGGLALADFEALSGQNFQTLSNSVSATIPTGVTFSSTGGYANDLFVAPTNFGGSTAISTPSLFSNYFDSPLIASFSPDVTAVGSYVISYSTTGDTSAITITVRNADSSTTDYVVAPAAGSSAFFGIIATGGDTIDRITYDPLSGYTAGVDDFRFGIAAEAIPEPATFVLLTTGALIARFTRRRRRPAA